MEGQKQNSLLEHFLITLCDTDHNYTTIELEGPKDIGHRDLRRGTKILYNGQVSSVDTFLRVAALC
jgi:hypothetical protein